MINLVFGTNVVRWIAVADIAVLLACGLWSNVALRRVMTVTPLMRRHYLAGFGHAVVEVAVAAGVIANVASTFPPTPGVKVLACIATPAALYVALVLFWRAGRAVRN